MMASGREHIRVIYQKLSAHEQMACWGLATSYVVTYILHLSCMQNIVTSRNEMQPASLVGRPAGRPATNANGSGLTDERRMKK